MSDEPTTDDSDGFPSADLTPPVEMVTAVRLMWAGAALSVVSGLIAIVTQGDYADRVADRMRQTDPGVTQTQIDSMVAVGTSFTVFIGLVGAAVWLWMGWKNGQGRAWARATATVLGAINVALTILGIAGGQYDAFTSVVSVVNLVLAVVILWLLWRKDSTAFYDAVANRHTI